MELNSYDIHKFTLDDEDYEDGVAIIGYVAEPEGDLVLPRELDGYPVTGVGVDLATLFDKSYAFEGCANLISVTIPDGVISIYEEAFMQCGSLTTVTIPDSGNWVVEDLGPSGSEALFGSPPVDKNNDCKQLYLYTVP